MLLSYNFRWRNSYAAGKAQQRPLAVLLRPSGLGLQGGGGAWTCRVSVWGGETGKRAIKGAALAAFAALEFTVIVMLLHRRIPLVEDPRGKSILLWNYRLAVTACR